MNAFFGPAGNEDSFSARYRSTLAAPAWLREQGLDAYEYQCGRGVGVGEATAKALGEAMAKENIALSLHTPYYISLTNPDRLAQNIDYLLQSAQASRWMGAKRMVVHTGTAGGDRQKALETAAYTLGKIHDALCQAGFDDIVICPETMGKAGQLGTLSEVAALCRIHPFLLPCVDFGHLYARSLGAMNSEAAFGEALDELIAALGLDRVRALHIHFSQIEFGKSGEIRHLTLQNGQFGPDFAELARALQSRGFAPVFICESRGTQAADAADMRRIWNSAAASR